MPTLVTSTNRFLTTEHDAALARDVVGSLDREDAWLMMGGQAEAGVAPLPREIGNLIHEVLRAIANGCSVTVTAVPPELTTSSAAALLGISRPTLMRMVDNEEIPAHRVGSHTRLMSADVLAARKNRRERERAAFTALFELEGNDE